MEVENDNANNTKKAIETLLNRLVKLRDALLFRRWRDWIIRDTPDMVEFYTIC